LTKKKSAQKQKKSKKFTTLFISLKVAQGAQEAPKQILEHSLIGKGKIDHEVLRGYHCGRVLSVLSKDIFFKVTWPYIIYLDQQLMIE
jgi:hypothetical protein